MVNSFSFFSCAPSRYVPPSQFLCATVALWFKWFLPSLKEYKPQRYGATEKQKLNSVCKTEIFHYCEDFYTVNLVSSLKALVVSEKPSPVSKSFLLFFYSRPFAF